MARRRVYTDRADKQRAYRERADLSGDLLQLRADLQRLAQNEQTIVIDPMAIDTTANGREVFRQLVKQIKAKRG